VTAQSELLLVVDAAAGTTANVGAAVLQQRPSLAEVPGQSSPAGFRFVPPGAGEYLLRYEPKPGAAYRWHVNVSLNAGAISVRTATSIHSTDVVHACAQARERTRYQATVRANLGSYWDGRARELIGFARGQTPPTFVEMNRRITSAYARMYLSNPRLFKWAGMAAFASKAVGDGIRQAQDFSEAFLPLPPIPGIDATMITGTEIKQWLAQGNMLVYADIYWQHLAFAESGLEMLRYEESQERLMPVPLRGWTTIATGARSGDEEAIWAGNRELLRFEQWETLQKGVYGPNRELWRTLCSRPVKWFQTFASPIPGDPTPFEGSDFGDPEQRWRWIDGSMLPAWRRLESDRARARDLLSALV
jgi:hypothetical protein